MGSSTFAVAKRYSAALWELADSQEEALGWLEELNTFVEILDTSNELNLVLSGGTYAPSERKAVLDNLAEKIKPSAQIERFLQKVQEAGRMYEIKQITQSFERKILEAGGTREATLETAVTLSKTQLKEIQSKLEAMSGKKIKLTERLAPELIAGIRVHMAGETIDASLLSTLNKMEKRLADEGTQETLH